jgi:hypothetical protein
VVATILKLIVEERPLLCLGLPGMILMLLAMTLGTYMLLLFNASEVRGTTIIRG